jgi:hypothetical protein
MMCAGKVEPLHTRLYHVTCRRSAKVPPNAQAPRKLAPEITAEALDGDPVCGEVRGLELMALLP